jgi:translocation and assembly module TamB
MQKLMSDAATPDRPDDSALSIGEGKDVQAVRKGMSRRRKLVLGGTAIVIVLGGGLWLQRMAISDELIRQQLADRAIPASYQIEAIGLRTQRLTNVVIGDKNHPDLIAKTLELTLDWGFTGPTIRGVRADGVRLIGRYKDGKISFGHLDKFSDPDSTEPFTPTRLSGTAARCPRFAGHAMVECWDGGVRRGQFTP